MEGERTPSLPSAATGRRATVPRLLGMEWTKSWTGEPHHPSARGSARRDFLDCRPQLIIWKCSGVVHCDLAGAIEQHQGGSRGGAVGVEVGFADGDWHVEQSGVEAAADGIDVGELVLGSSLVGLGGVPVKPRGSDDRQSLGREFRAQLSDDRRFSFAVATPVSPKEKQHRRSFQRSPWLRLGAEKLLGFEYRGGLPCQGQHIQVFLQSCAY